MKLFNSSINVLTCSDTIYVNCTLLKLDCVECDSNRWDVVYRYGRIGHLPANEILAGEPTHAYVVSLNALIFT